MHQDEKKLTKATIIMGSKLDPFDSLMETSTYSWERIKQYCSNETFMQGPISVIDYYNELRKRVNEADPSDIHDSILKLTSVFDSAVIYDESPLDFIRKSVEGCVSSGSIVNTPLVKFIRGTIWGSTDPDCNDFFVFQYDPQGYMSTAPSGKLLRPAVVWPGEEFRQSKYDFEKDLQESDIIVFIGVDLNNHFYDGIANFLVTNNKKEVIFINDDENSFGEFTKRQLNKYTVYNKLTPSMIENVKNECELILNEE